MRSDRTIWIIMGIIAAAVVLLMVNDGEGRTFGMDNSGFATLIWAGLIGTVIGAGLLSRAGPGGGGGLLRLVAIWLAIFVGLVVGYRLYNGQPVFPGEEAPNSGSGTGVTVFLMEPIDRGLHLGSPDDIS